MSLPTILRRAAAESPRRFLPAKSSRSAVTRAVQGNRPMTASMATLLPEPDSPTIATTSPCSTASSIPSTALNGPLMVGNSTVRLAISRSATLSSA